MQTFSLPAIPAELHWQAEPLNWELGPDGSLAILAGPKTDWFVDPAGTFVQDNVPGALFAPPDTSFLLSARVTADFASDYDAGALQLRADAERWVKLALEYSPQGEPIVVSVVTRGISDDCNSVVIAERAVHLRMAVTPRAIALHYSRDGHTWHFVRHFTIGKLDGVRVGFSAQSPTGRQCRAVFSEISYRAGELKDLRSGE